MTDTIYISTSIPYVNSKPHIGHAQELVQADVIARYNRLLGNTVYFQTGTDDNAFKNVLSARKEGVSTRTLVDRNAQHFIRLGDRLNISSDRFIRTTDTDHTAGVHRLWQQLDKGDLDLRPYRGRYCDGCEDFLQEGELIDGRCPDHDTKPLEVAESNYFFNLSGYQDRIGDLLDSGNIRVVPEKRKNEILSFIRSGIHDISVSRDAGRSGGWGIGVPEDPSQTIYVWIDALINYISGIGYGTGDDWSGLWNEHTRKIHVIGKDIWKFHCVYWPALLISAGLPLPDTILIHGFITVNGRKISKSLGNAVDPFAYVTEYGADAVRYYLLRAISPFEDGDFSPEGLKGRYNSDLANGLGNLVKRLATLWEKGGCGSVPAFGTPDAPEGYHAHLAAYEFNKALIALWAVIGETNRDIDSKRPWELLKSGDLDGLQRQLSGWFGRLYTIAYWLEPFLPATSRTVLDLLSRGPDADGSLFPRVS